MKNIEFFQFWKEISFQNMESHIFGLSKAWSKWSIAKMQEWRNFVHKELEYNRPQPHKACRGTRRLDVKTTPE